MDVLIEILIIMYLKKVEGFTNDHKRDLIAAINIHIPKLKKKFFNALKSDSVNPSLRIKA